MLAKAALISGKTLPWLILVLHTNCLLSATWELLNSELVN